MFFKEGSATSEVEVNYPVGHRRRRSEGIPLLIEKFERYLLGGIESSAANLILEICMDPSRFEEMRVDEMMNLLVQLPCSEAKVD